MLYSYKYRPHYGYTGFLIEFFSGSNNQNCLTNLIIALKTIKPKGMPLLELYHSDEILAPFDSEIGKFEVDKDIYGNVFILGSDETTKAIHEILQQHPKYESLKVDFTKYQLKKK
jgi:hypothetical protein